MTSGIFFETNLIANDQDSVGQSFWNQRGDGRADLAGDDLISPCYGALRKGVAVAIFTNERNHERGNWRRKIPGLHHESVG